MPIRTEIRRLLAATCPALALLFLLLSADPGRAQTNVLMINVDDLNAFPGDYYPDLETPNLDRLAAAGASFANAHSPVPACNPSRTAILMGMNPETTGITLNSQPQFRTLSPILADKPSLPQQFKNAGYRIVGAGKLFHLPNDDAPYTEWDIYTLPLTSGDFNVPGGIPTNGLAGLMLTDPDGINSGIPSGIDFGFYEFNDSPSYVDATTSTPDYQRAAWGANQIATVESESAPLFVSIGIYRPHLPHYCPKRFYDLLPDPIQDVPHLETDLDDVPDPMGGYSVDADFEFASARDGVDYENQHARAYVACVAFADELIGMLLDAVDASTEPWLVALWGDHGFHVGEKDRWQKLTLWERGTHTTLILAGPGIASGADVDLAVSLIDIYPTLTDYAGIPTPDHLGGQSLRRMLDGTVPDVPIKLLLDQKDERYFAYKSVEWNYITNTATGSEELYDRINDREEWWNVAGDPQNEPIKSWLVPEPSLASGIAAGLSVLTYCAGRRNRR